MKIDFIKKIKHYFGNQKVQELLWIEESIKRIEDSYYSISDEEYNYEHCKEVLGYYPDFKHPKTFTEKLLVLKMYYQNDLQNICADKVNVMDYVKQCGYEDILKKTYQICDSVDEINWTGLPEKFFIQCSHTQGSNFVVDKSDKRQIRYIRKLYKIIFNRKQYMIHRENCYKNITPKIICCELLTESGKSGLTDYKFYCFEGKPKYFMVSYGEYEHNVKNHKFDMEWNSIDYLFKSESVIDADKIHKPKNFDKMVEVATKLSAPFPHVRVDLYNIDGRIVFGEMTFYSSGGFVKVSNREMDEKIGSWIPLEKYIDLDGDENEREDI